MRIALVALSNSIQIKSRPLDTDAYHCCFNSLPEYQMEHIWNNTLPFFRVCVFGVVAVLIFKRCHISSVEVRERKTEADTVATEPVATCNIAIVYCISKCYTMHTNGSHVWANERLAKKLFCFSCMCHDRHSIEPRQRRFSTHTEIEKEREREWKTVFNKGQKSNTIYIYIVRGSW